MLNDVRAALRQLRKSPGFSLIVTLTLALGIGASTTIFSVIDAVLLRPLPYGDPDRLVRVFVTKGDSIRDSFSGPDFLDVRAQAGVFTSVSAWRQASVAVLREGRAVRADAAIVTPSFFDLLQTRPLHGRAFLDADRRSSFRPVVLSYEAWQRHFGGRPTAINQSVEIDRQPHQVVGVLPAAFRGPLPADIWIVSRGDVPESPFPGQEDLSQNRDVHYFNVFARLAPGVTIDQAGARLDALARNLARAYPASNEGRGLRVVSLRDDLVGEVRPALLILFVAVGVVLAVVAVNIASLLVARAAARQREMAIRAAIGAGRGRLVRQLVAESLLLGMIGGAAGFTLALWALKVFVALNPGDVPRLADATIDLRMFAFSAILSCLVAVLVGLVPAFQASRTDLVSVFRQGAGGGRARQGLRTALVGIELAAAVALLVVAGLLGRSFYALQNVPLGFNVTDVYTVGLPLPEHEYRDETRQANFFRALLPKVKALPGVSAVAAAFPRPLSGGRGSGEFEIAGRAPARPGEQPSAGIFWITPDYFRVLRVPLLRGRAFNDADRGETSPVIIVNERMAQRYWPNEDPVGVRIRFDSASPWMTIVGVAGNTRGYELGAAPEPDMYVAHAQSPIPFMSLLISVDGATEGLNAAVRAAVASIDPKLPAGDLSPMQRSVDELLAPSRFRSVLLLAFGAAALVLAALGVYGVVSYSVAQRTSEIGIRVALGATRPQIRGLVMGHALRLAVIAAACGMLLALTASRWLSAVLFSVSPTDPITLMGAAITLVLVAIVASYLPARRAMAIEPARALRTE